MDELENIILSKVSQAQKARNHMFSLMQIIDLLLDLGHTLRREHIQKE
jgi:hypothetical protein